MTSALDRPRLVPAFVAIIASFLLANIIAVREMRASQMDVQSLVTGTLAREQLIMRLERDVNQKRLLLDAHIYEKSALVMQELEGQIAGVDTDLDATSHAFDAVASPRSRGEWDALRGELAASAPRIEHAIELSRVNRDDDAQQLMLSLVPRFRVVGQMGDRLVDAGRDEARDATRELQARDKHALFALSGLTLVGIALALTIMMWTLGYVRRRENQLRAMTTQLSAQNSELDAFAGRVAHDLRGPLNTINLAATRLAERAPQEATTASTLQRGVSRMERIIQDLLMLSRVDSDAQGFGSDPASAASSIVEEFAASIAGVGGSISVTLAPATVRCTDGLLHQVLWNLVENAVKYRGPATPPKIIVFGETVGTAYELRVSDNGIGMSREEARHVFEPFYRGERAPTRAPGTGLGLSIVKRIVEACGGAISVDSQIDHGTTFIVDLPMQHA